MIGHNLSFDAKMLLANGVHIADGNLVDTILIAGLALRGLEDTPREGSRRPSLADAVKEALGIDLPKTSQLSPWWRDRLTQVSRATGTRETAPGLTGLMEWSAPVLVEMAYTPELQKLYCEAVLATTCQDFAATFVPDR
jgi:hypothetical protein